MVSAILDIVLGGMIFLRPVLGATFIWIMLSLSFILDSLFELWVSRYIRQNNKSYFWLNVILGVVGVILGIILLFSPATAVGVSIFLLSFYFMFFGILLIVRSF